MSRGELTYPQFNLRSKCTKAELQIMLNELPMFFEKESKEFHHLLSLLPSDHLDNYEQKRHKQLLEILCGRMSRLDLFGHVDFLKGFVKPGALTTRFEISLGIMSCVIKHLSKKSRENVVFSQDDHELAIVPFFDVLEMPNADIEKDMIAKMNQRNYDPTRHTPYIRWLYNHLPPSIEFLWNMKMVCPNPKIKFTRPHLRIMRLGVKEFVYVDEVKWALWRLKPNLYKNEKFGKFKWQFHYFPFEYLEYALGLYGLTLDNFQLVTDPVELNKKDIYCYSHGPSGENLLPAQCCFFRWIKDIGKLHEEKKDSDMLSLFETYEPMLIANQVLPYMVRYFGAENRRCRSSNVSSYVPRRKTISKFSKRSKSIPKQTVIFNVDDYLKADPPFEETFSSDAFDNFPGGVKGLAMKFMCKQQKFALLLHEQGYCQPGEFCYAKLFSIDEKTFKCEMTPDVWKRRVEYALKEDLKFRTTRHYFDRHSGDATRFKFNIEEAQEIMRKVQKREKRADTPVPYRGKPPVNKIGNINNLGKGYYLLPEPDDGGPVPTVPAKDQKETVSAPEKVSPNVSVDENSGTISSANSDVEQPAETENEPEKDNSPQKSVKEAPQDTDSMYRMQYDRMIQTIEEEHQEEVEKLNKTINNGLKKQEEDRALCDRQKMEIKELKKKLESIEKEKKETQTRLEGDIKRISAEKLRVEDNFEKFKTEKAINDPESRIKESNQIMEKALRSAEAYKLLVCSKDKELNTLRLENDKRDIAISRWEKKAAELEEKLRNNKDLLAIRELNKELTSELRKSELKVKQKDEKIDILKKSLQRSDNHFFALKGKLQRIDVLQQEKDRILEMKNILEDHATPSIKAAVKRIEALTKLLEESKNDESIFNLAFKKLKAYEAVEDKENYEDVMNAHSEYDSSRAEKIVYESNLTLAIQEITVNPQHYFLMSNKCFVTEKKKTPFSAKTVKRMAELHDKIEEEMRRDYLNNQRHQTLKQK